MTFYDIPKDNLTTTDKISDYSDSPVVGSWKCTKVKINDVEVAPEDVNAGYFYLTFNADGTVETVLSEGHQGKGIWSPGRTNEIEYDYIDGEWSYDKHQDSILNISEETDDGKMIYYFTRCE